MSAAGTVVVRKTISAPRREVFEAWTDAAGMAEWMCPGDATGARARLDVRVGGEFEIVMVGPSREVVHTGTYRVVDPPRKLVFTWLSMMTDGRPTLVTVEFLSRGRGTEVVVTHEGLPEPRAASHRNGWGRILELLGEHLASAGSRPD